MRCFVIAFIIALAPYVFSYDGALRLETSTEYRGGALFPPMQIAGFTSYYGAISGLGPSQNSAIMSVYEREICSCAKTCTGTSVLVTYLTGIVLR